MKSWLWPGDRRPRCPVTEGGEPCPWLASVDVTFGQVPHATAAVRLCHWHAVHLTRDLIDPAQGHPQPKGTP